MHPAMVTCAAAWSDCYYTWVQAWLSCLQLELWPLCCDQTNILATVQPRLWWVIKTHNYDKLCSLFKLELDNHTPKGPESPSLLHILNCLSELTKFLLEPLPVVESFLSLLLEVWEGVAYQSQVCALLGHLSLQPFSGERSVQLVPASLATSVDCQELTYASYVSSKTFWGVHWLTPFFRPREWFPWSTEGLISREGSHLQAHHSGYSHNAF